MGGRGVNTRCPSNPVPRVGLRGAQTGTQPGRHKSPEPVLVISPRGPGGGDSAGPGLTRRLTRGLPTQTTIFSLRASALAFTGGRGRGAQEGPRDKRILAAAAVSQHHLL